ncbi:MAG: hypothetical protein JOZ18_23780 [Chloroflexi bacterium]|nr:hypothetical protein [Chloroflexota bacterium]
MLGQLLFFLCAQTIFIAVFSIVGLRKIRLRQRALQQEIAAGNTSLEAYQRFMAARTSTGYTTRLLTARTIMIAAPCIGLIVFLSVIFNSFIPDLLNFFLQASVLYPLLLAPYIGYYIGGRVHDIVGALVVDAEAVRFFQVSNLQRSEIATLKRRQALLQWLPSALFWETLAILFIFTSSGSLFDVLLLLLALCLCSAMVIGVVFDAPLYAFTHKLQPIAQTQWATLAPRIAAWAHLAGVEFSSIQIQQAMPDTIDMNISGLGKPMLIISEFFLRHSEWRQQDALVSMLIGLAKRKVNLHTFLDNLISVIIVVAYVLVLPFTKLSSTDVLALAITFLSPLLLLIVAYILMSTISAYSRRLQTRDYIEADRMASFLTGDPVAVMVVLNLIYALSGVTMNQQDERMRNLDELARQPWPRAPQAALPVPAVCEVSYDSHLLTASMDGATTPGPVPTAPYR